jgi:KDO2-lipid IV(A) lauroyltransferase
MNSIPLSYQVTTAFAVFVAKIIQKLPYSFLHCLGKILGLGIYYFFPKYRKRILSNLSLAKALQLDEEKLQKTALQSLQSLAIALLEFPKLYTEKNLEKIASCENPTLAKDYIDQKKGVVFFCAHQANWELFFLEGNARMPGTAIGRPIKNSLLYSYILKVRTRFGGEIIHPKSALKEGLKALKAGKFLGIVGDQGMPESSFQSTFLGVNAFSTTAPALLAYKTNSPLFVATMKRKNGKYLIRYSDPILPNIDHPLKEEVERMTLKSLAILEQSIIESPSEWLWLHNRFKQETPETVFYRYRHDSILIIVQQMSDIQIDKIRLLYPKAFLHFYSLNPKDQQEHVTIIDENTPLPKDYRFKFVINLTQFKKFGRHFDHLSALLTVDEKAIDQLIIKRHLPIPKQLDEKLIFAFARNPKELLKPYAP